MKRNSMILASLMMLICVKISAQNERVLLLESFTNTGCGPCAMYNPAMDALIAANSDKVAAIKYHVNWPSAADPMYLHNTVENGARTSYYGVNSVPHVVIDGNRFSDNPANINQSIIDQLQAIESPLEMRLSYEVDETANMITVHVMGRVSQTLSGTSKLYVGVIEREIHFSSSPGPNGERDFYSVMKKLLPSSSGYLLGNLEMGDYFAFTFSWPLANIYDMSQLDAIAWVQNQTTKEVYQACKSSQTMEPFYSNEAGVSEIGNVKSVTCSGIAFPKVKLSNFGSNVLTSAELDITVNDEVVGTYSWTGHLNTFDYEVVDLGEISFPVESDNALQVHIKSVNGTADEADSNDIVSCVIKGAPETVGKVLSLIVRTDNNPQETTWAVTKISTGEVVLQGGSYDTPNHTYTEILEINADGCYDLTIYDAGGDGLTDGNGFYGLKAGGTTLFSGGVFTDFESNEFSYEVSAGADENDVTSTSLYPNPTTGILNVITQDGQRVVIYNAVGQRVFEGMSKGRLQIDMKRFGSGVYAVQMGNETQRVVVK